MDDDRDLTLEEQEALAKRMSRRKKKRRPVEEMSLNINSMMDIMTILLVFLLISITSDPLAIKESNILKLSRSAAAVPVVFTIPIQVNRKEILVDNVKAVSVACVLNNTRPCREDELESAGTRFFIDAGDKEGAKKSSLLIVPLQEALKKAVKSMKDQNLDLPEEVRKKYLANQGVATIVCDRELPYRMIAEITYTTAMAELYDIRFAIVYTESR